MLLDGEHGKGVPVTAQWAGELRTPQYFCILPQTDFVDRSFHCFAVCSDCLVSVPGISCWRPSRLTSSLLSSS